MKRPTVRDYIIISYIISFIIIQNMPYVSDVQGPFYAGVFLFGFFVLILALTRFTDLLDYLWTRSGLQVKTIYEDYFILLLISVTVFICILIFVQHLVIALKATSVIMAILLITYQVCRMIHHVIKKYTTKKRTPI